MFPMLPKPILSLALPLLIVCKAAVAETVPAPSAIPHEKGSIVVSTTAGAPRWTAEWTMEPYLQAGRPAVRFTEAGRGRYSPYPQPVRWSLEAIWTADESFRPLRVDKTIWDEAGRMIATERKVFDAKRATVQFERKAQGRPDQTKQLPAPPDTLTVEGIAGILRFLPFDRWRPVTAHLLTNEPQLYDIKIEMRGKERIKTPAGEFNCYKIERQ